LTIPPIETGKADVLNDSNIWPRAMTIIGSHDSRILNSALEDEALCVAMRQVLRTGRWGALDWRRQPD
jgi:hypothetical protein